MHFIINIFELFIWEMGKLVRSGGRVTLDGGIDMQSMRYLRRANILFPPREKLGKYWLGGGTRPVFYP